MVFTHKNYYIFNKLYLYVQMGFILKNYASCVSDKGIPISVHLFVFVPMGFIRLNITIYNRSHSFI